MLLGNRNVCSGSLFFLLSLFVCVSLLSRRYFVQILPKSGLARFQRVPEWSSHIRNQFRQSIETTVSSHPNADDKNPAIQPRICSALFVVAHSVLIFLVFRTNKLLVQRKTPLLTTDAVALPSQCTFLHTLTHKEQSCLYAMIGKANNGQLLLVYRTQNGPGHRVV